MLVSSLFAGVIAVVCLWVGLWFFAKLQSRPAVFCCDPDTPKSFGHSMSWMAVRTQETNALVSALGLIATEEVNWKSGIGAVYDKKLSDYHVFVTPPVDGWSFVVGLSIPHPASERLVDKLTPLLVNLGNRFGEVQYYFSYPLIDFFAWARAVNGRVVRAFAICDEGVTWNRGRITEVEKKLGLNLFELRGVGGRSADAGSELIMYPTEDYVMRVSGNWGINPAKLDEIKEGLPAMGVIGIAPSAWRSQRAETTVASNADGASRDHLSAA